MHIEFLDSDVLMFRGQAYESIATAFMSGADVLLVDALASLQDAQSLRSHLEQEMGKSVRAIVLTHGMADHRAGLHLFPDATLMGHPLCAHLIREGEAQASPQATDELVSRMLPIAEGQEMSFGRHHLRFFHNEGKTPCSLGIEVPSSDLLFTADNLLGQIAFISRSTPELIMRGLDRLETRAGSRLVEGHQGVFPRTSIAGVRHYLRSLGEQVRIRRESSAGGRASSLQIPIEACLPPGVEATNFEREWHGHNLSLITTRNLFGVLDVTSPANP